MNLGIWKRRKIEKSKDKRIIDLLDNPNKEEKIRIDETFAFRTRAERF